MQLAKFDEVEKHKGLIVQRAVASWKKLPPKTRSYVEIRDMVQDGMLLVTRRLPKYNPKKAAITTFLQSQLDNFFYTAAKHLARQKRYDGNVLLIEDLKVDSSFDVVDKTIDEAATLEHVRKVFLKIYFEATESLRESMLKWFLQTEQTKIHTRGLKFKNDRAEFRRLAAKFGMDKDDCRFVMKSVYARNQIISQLPEFFYSEVN